MIIFGLRLDVEGDLFQEQLDSDDVLIFDAEVDRFLALLVEQVGIGSVVEQQFDNSPLHLLVLVGQQLSRFLGALLNVILLADGADQMQAGVADVVVLVI